MDPAALITATVPLLAVIGGGIGFLINRADKDRRENRAAMIEHLKAQLQEKDRENRELRRENRLLRADGTSWREQLIANDISPQPGHWTELEDTNDS